MKNSKSSLTLAILLSSLLLTSCGSETSTKSAAIRKEDYSVYSEYWFDKTIAEVGEGKAEVESLVHDFGIMPPQAEGTHRFKIKNNGEYPLCFLAGPKSCKCTGLKIIDREIPPGETGEVEVKWETVALAETFQHTASVYTNDSSDRQIKFTIKGNVGIETSVIPSRILMGRFLPNDAEKTESIVVFSDQWDEFEIRNLNTSFGDAATVQVKPLSETQKSRPEFRRAKFGKTIELTLKNPGKRGHVSGLVNFAVVGTEKTVEHSIKVDAKVVRRIRLEETNSDVLTPSGIVRLRRVPRQTGKKEKFLLTVLDQDKDLKIREASVEPDYVEVQLKPLNSKTSKHGIYTLEVTIPENQQQANFNRIDSFGKLDIEFDHPRIEPLNLKLDFYIL